MNQSEVAKRYAKALLSVTKESNNQLKILEQLKVLRGIFQEADIKAFYASPVVSREQKSEALKKALAGVSLEVELSNFLLLLTRNGRTDQLPAVLESLQSYIDSESGITRGVIRAAKPLALELKNALESQIAGALNRKIVLTFKEDPSILGGVVADVGGWTFDDSVEMHLRRMNEELLKN